PPPPRRGGGASGRCARRPPWSRSPRCCAICSTCWPPAPSCTLPRTTTTAASASSIARAASERPSAPRRRSISWTMPRSSRTGGWAAMPSPCRAPDPAARDLIRERLDVNLLVEAGAGSGKTECLAQRMAAGVLEGRYEVEKMAAVTFTRKAAAELRGRFQLTLERALEAERDETRKERAHQALWNLEALFAGTIPAFCPHPPLHPPCGGPVRGHHPRLLRPPAARAAGRGRRGAGLHRAGRDRPAGSAAPGLA